MNVPAAELPAPTGLPVLRAALLGAGVPCVHGFLARQGGVSAAPYDQLNLSPHVGDVPAAVAENRRRAAVALQRPAAPLVTLRQVHGEAIVEVTRNAGKNIEADGLWSRDPEVVLGILTADCVPILFADVLGRCVAAVHAGWRGTAARIAGRMVERLGQQDVAPAQLRVALGPAIGPCCFEVGPEVASALSATLPGAAAALQRRGEAQTADLWLLNSLVLQAMDVAPAHIEALRHCTCCGRGFYSHRRQSAAGQATGRQGALIARGPKN